MAKMTALHLRFPGWVFTAMSPTATLPILAHSCCKLGPAAWLSALAQGFCVKFRFDAAVPTKMSACQMKRKCLSAKANLGQRTLKIAHESIVS